MLKNQVEHKNLMTSCANSKNFEFAFGKEIKLQLKYLLLKIKKTRGWLNLNINKVRPCD